MEKRVAGHIKKAEEITGWMSVRELMWLATQAQRCNVIVEFGCFHGRSTRALADNCPGTVYAVDPWNGDYPATDEGVVLNDVNTYVMPEFMNNLRDHIISGKVQVRRTFSSLFTLDEPVDMVFLDGDHRYKTVIKDIEKGFSLLRQGGILCGHDYGHSLWTGVKKAVDELVGPKYLEDTIWWTLKY